MRDDPLASPSPAGSPRGADGAAQAVAPSLKGGTRQQAAGGVPPGTTAPPAAAGLTDQQREEAELELATLRRHVSELKRNQPATGPFGHNALAVQLWRERVARVEREVERLCAALAPADEAER